MEHSFILTYINRFKIFPFLLKLISLKFRRLSGFISILYVLILAKLKLQVVQIKALDAKHFKNLIKENKYNCNFKGDIYGCAIVSLNTLLTLSIRNSSWLKIGKLPCHINKNFDFDQNLGWNIKIPPVDEDSSTLHQDDNNYYYIQCLCLSSILEDFTLFVTEEKLFNISKLQNKENDYSEIINAVLIEKINSNFSISIAKSAIVVPISSCDITINDYEYILQEHFSEPKLLRVRDTFKICLKDHIKHLKSNFLDVDNVYFRVVKLSGDLPDSQLYYVSKECTNLYLNPPEHGFLPQKRALYIGFNEFKGHITISCCPEGLSKQFEHLKSLFLPFLKCNDFALKPIFLLSGPTGSGKKSTIRAISSFFGLNLIQGNCFDFYGLNPSLTKGKIQQIFTRVRRTVPCVIYFENVELLGREQNYNENPRLVDIFITELEELWERKSFAYPVFFVGSTPADSADIVLPISRLFVETVMFKPLEPEESFKTLRWLIEKFKMTSSSEELLKVVEKCKGYVYGDFELLVKHALGSRLEECSTQDYWERELSLKNFKKAIEIMDAAYSDSIGAARVPCVQWDDIGGLEDIKEEIMLTLNLPLKHPELFSSELKRSGIIFYGPPGTGKTLMAKAIATECNYNFLSVKGPELMNMYVGESEKNVREVFERARDAAPCIIFFDELDALAPSRGKSGDSGGVTDRVVSQLLTEMDGLDENKNVFVLGATNRPDLVDPALLRPGRFDKMFYVGICNDTKSKLSVLKALTRRFLLDADVDLEKVANELPNHISGADLYSVASNAWFSAARKSVEKIEKDIKVNLPLMVCAEDFQNAIDQFVPSLSDESLQYYQTLSASENT